MAASRYALFLACICFAAVACGCSASSMGEAPRASEPKIAAARKASSVSHADAETRVFLTPLATDSRSLAFAEAIGVDCNANSGAFQCVGGRIEVGDYFDVMLNPRCAPEDFTLRAKAGAELRDKITPLDTRTVATVGTGAALCAQAVGSIKNEPEYYYVVMQSVPASCATAGTISKNRNGCHSGWIEADSLTH